MIISSLLNKKQVFNTAALLSVAGGVATGTSVPDLSMVPAGYIADLAQRSCLDASTYGVHGNDRITSILEIVSPTEYIFRPSRCFHSKLEREAYELFGNLRELSLEERLARKKTMDKISRNTGVSFFDI